MRTRSKDVKDSAVKQLAKRGGQASPVKPVSVEVIVPTLNNVVVDNGEAKTTETESAMAAEVLSSDLKVEGDLTSTVASDMRIEPLQSIDTNTDINISVKQEDIGVVPMDVVTSDASGSVGIKNENTTNLDPSSGPSSVPVPSSGPSSDPMSIVTLSCVRCPCVYHWDCAKVLGPTDGAAVGDANQFICCKCR